MKKIVMYQCSECGKVSSEYDEILNCELQHLGLTKYQYLEWKKLKEQAEQAGRIVSHTKNSQTDKVFDEAIKALVNFEEQHKITMDLFPIIE